MDEEIENNNAAMDDEIEGGVEAAGDGTGFIGNCGQNGEITSQVGLQVNEQVSINGNTDLHLCIQGESNACVYAISLALNSGPFEKYVLNVDAQGPYGMFSGSMDLYFTDQTGDTYELTITDSHRKMHTVSYNSNQPAIVKISWK